MPKLSDNVVRIPVKFTDNTLEYYYGGSNFVKEGSYAELIIEKQNITDAKLLEGLTKKSLSKMMNAEITLIVALSVDENVLDQDLKDCLKPANCYSIPKNPLFSRYVINSRTQFIEVKIGRYPSPSVDSIFAEGGIWLELEGMEPKGLKVSHIKLPDCIDRNDIFSLNHAFTVLSEKYEPMRKSHTGNVYDRFFYKEENDQWYPLNVLRNAAIAHEEHAFVARRWKEICVELNLNFNK